MAVWQGGYMGIKRAGKRAGMDRDSRHNVSHICGTFIINYID